MDQYICASLSHTHYKYWYEGGKLKVPAVVHFGQGIGHVVVVVNAYRVWVETGAERNTIVDIFDIIQQVRDIGIHLKVVDEEQMADHAMK